MRPNHGVVLTLTDDVGLPLDPSVPNPIAHCVRSLTSYLRCNILTSSRRLKDPSPVHDDEVLGIVDSLNKWKEGLPKYGRDPGQDIPMLTPDRLLKGYYMVSEGDNADKQLTVAGPDSSSQT